MFYFKYTRKPDFKKAIKINYNDYNKYWKVRGFELRSKLMAREVICLEWIKANSSVLDVGCGNSRLLYELKNRKNCKVLALDVSDLVINTLEKEGISGRVIDISNSNFEFFNDNEFDFIILNEILEHLPNPETVLKRIRRKGKQFVISIPNIGFYRYRIGLMFKGRFPTQWEVHPSEHLRYWTHKDFLDWLAALDFEVIDCQVTDGFRFCRKNFKNLFGHMISYLVRNKS